MKGTSVKRRSPRRQRRGGVDYIVRVNGQVIGQGPHLGRYLRDAARRFPKAVPHIGMIWRHAVAIFVIR